jgi:glucose-6-phosphate 1-dehydrogenase
MAKPAGNKQRCAKPAPVGPCGMVIFGATGDLTRRLLFPAIYNLAADGLLPKEFAIIGVGRRDNSHEGLQQILREGLEEHATRKVDRKIAERLLSNVTFMPANFSDPRSYARLSAHMNEVAVKAETKDNWLFYLATPPSAFGTVVEQLGKAGLAKEANGTWRRVVVEKPFGTDFESANALDALLHKSLAEDQIFRIDHYLGKETVQNIMALRFANGLFEPLWSREHIDHVQITVAETVGVEERGRFYDPTGALRDMVPNHLFQLLTLTAMEPPTAFDAHAVRSEKTKVLEAVREFTPQEVVQNVVRGQYTAGEVADHPVVAYRKAEHVAPDSNTETYVAMKLTIDNWRWAGVPFYLRTGKALATRTTEIAVNFKRAPFTIFRGTPVEHLPRNFMILRIQPNEGIDLRINAKVPGPSVRIGSVGMDFAYKDYFDVPASTGYETLIYDCMIGDATLFQRADTIEAGWRVVQPVLDHWQARGKKRELQMYPAGGWGPEAADALLERDGRHWVVSNGAEAPKP